MVIRMSDKRIKNIKVIAMDVDGTLTDGAIYIGKDGEMMKAFDVKDGLGISLLNRSGIITSIITGRTSQIVQKRADELKITKVMQGISKKDEALQHLADECCVKLENIAYIGDDSNDLPALLNAGLAVCPADSADMVKEKCDVVLRHSGGHGAIRELAELILKEQGKLEQVLEDLYGLHQ